MNKFVLFIVLLLLPLELISKENSYTIVVRSKASEKGAVSSVKELSKFGTEFKYLKFFTKYGLRYRICFGDYKSFTEADSARKIVAQKTNIKDAWVMNLSDYFNTDKFIESYANFAMSFLANDFGKLEKFHNPDWKIMIIHGREAKDTANYSFYTTSLSAALDTIALLGGINRQDIYKDFSLYCSELPKPKSLPVYKCDSSHYVSEGHNMLPVKSRSKILKNSDHEIIVVNSKSKYIFALHFALIGERWYLSAIRIVPLCNIKN